jgi:subtilase family serine protease
MQPRPTRLYRFVPVCIFPLVVFLFASAASAKEAQVESSTVQPRIVQPVDETRLTVLPGNTHRLARPQFDQGAAPPDLPMERMLLVLKRSPEQDGALHKLLDDQQDKASPSYHKWLTPEQFGKQFGPAGQDIQTVTAWLQSHGFRIGQVAKGRNMIEFSGTAAQVQEALRTTIHKYVVHGEEHWANSSDPQIPTALTPVVAGVHTLHNFLKKPLIHFSGEKVSAKYVPGKPPEVNFQNGVHGLGPADYATIYNINPLYLSGIKGLGIELAVVARSNLYQNGQDVSNFQNIFGCCVTFVITLNGPDPGDLGGGEELEATLDATWPGAVAPGATVDFVVSATTNTTDGIDLSELYIIDNNIASVMTESFGSCEAGLNTTEAQSIEALAEQAAAQGITYMVSAGDAGAEGCDDFNTETVATGPISVNVLAATRYNVAVGGTMFNENGQTKYWSTTNGQGYESALSYIPENVWNESCTAAQCGANANILAGSGGFSTFFPKPSWQSGVAGIPNDGHRDLPDVSLTAAGHDPYLLCLEASCVPDSQGNFFLYFVSGTSASAPSFAGIMALVDQKMGRQGQANYILYPLAAKEKLSQCNGSNTTAPPASTCVFNDVTVGNNEVPGEPGYPNAPYSSGVGYDQASGLGSVNVTNLVNNWNTVTFKPTVTTLSLSPTTITHGQTVNVDITVAPQSGSGTPTGDVSLIAAAHGPFGLIAVPLLSHTLNGGALSTSTNSLPGGQYSLTAHYAGDGTYAPSDSARFPPVTVNPEPSNTTAVALGYPDQNGHFPVFTTGPYGTFVYLRADVKGQSGFGTPTGNVTFLDGTANVSGDPYNLNSQGNTATPNGLFTFAAGAHSITATYNGDPSFSASPPSGPVSFTITPAATTTTVTALGTALAATVTTKSGGVGPTGTVTFLADGVQVGNPVAVTSMDGVIDIQTDTVAKGASATASTTASKAPSSSFKAIYSGDTNYVPSTSSSVADFSLSASAPTLTVAIPGASGKLTLTVTAIDGLPGVQFSATSCAGLPSESTCSFSPASIAGSGTTTLTVTTKAATAAILRPEILRPEHHRGPGWLMATSGLTLAGIVLLGVPSKRRRGNALLSLMIAGFLTLSACGGGGGSTNTPPPDPGTQPGSYPVVVTATSGTLMHTVSFKLAVQ